MHKPRSTMLPTKVGVPRNASRNAGFIRQKIENTRACPAARSAFPFSFVLIPPSNLFRISDFGFRILLALAFTLLVLRATAQKVGIPDPLPEELQKVFASQTDYWGEAAMR